MSDDASNNEALEQFLDARMKIAVPPGDAASVKLLARELVLGVHRNLWSLNVTSIPSRTISGESIPWEENLQKYMASRWNDVHIGHKKHLLLGYGYLDDLRDNSGRSYNRLSREAFALLEKTEPYNVFISYKRSVSSALALLCVCRLKAEDLVPFVDMALEAGGNWHADLEERIKDNDYFIILLGKDTLSSPMTVKEIQWALKYERTIIPVWHSGFDISDAKWKEAPADVMDVIQQTNAIIVQDESASGYNTAIVELLSRFGIMP